jgi:hypothetical protein
MYTNIDSKHGIQVISSWLEDFKEKISADFPAVLFIKILQIVMTRNVFQLDDTYWLET